ncbi:hypothetical protein CLV47_1031 [Antricoccus suffuscus]|uniref:Uncharacterized protein n=1 Tax=Antricoccus suffuscus TaxID=1629062 RepID=A0A2T1A2W2_9ACTN|nr:hypothetical protein [Antricoccus suffuscus]PRZ42951.1 hypothetical protein CLV47_1031 [Antricoccus suffuscus]
MSTKTLEEDFAAVMAAYRAMPPASKRPNEEPEPGPSLRSAYCRVVGTTTICHSGSVYCYWFGDTFRTCNSY